MNKKSSFPEDIKVKANLKWTKLMYEHFDEDYALKLVKKFNLPLNKTIGRLSTGNRTIFNVIVTLASNQPIMIFDEPTIGLDASHRSLFYKELLLKFSELNNIIIISTHLIDEVSNLLNHVIIINEGEVLVDCDIETILQSAYLVFGETASVNEYIKKHKVVKSEEYDNFKIVTIYESLSVEDKKDIERLGLKLDKPKLQEIFISLTQKGEEENVQCSEN